MKEHIQGLTNTWLQLEASGKGYSDALQAFYSDFHSGDRQSFDGVIDAPRGRKEVLNVLDREKIDAVNRLVVVKMHDDDEGIAAGTIKRLSGKGVAVFMITVTNGDGRPREGLTREELAAQRKREAVSSALELGVAGYFNLGYPDMEVGDRASDIKRTLVPYLRMIDPNMVMTLNPQDHNPDHRDGAKMVYDALYASRNNFYPSGSPDLPISKNFPALYYMDTQSLVNNEGKTIKPGVLVRVCPEDKGCLNRAMLAYSTQYDSDEHLWEFKARAHERGKLIGWKGAEGVTQEVRGAFSTKDLITEILNGDVLPTNGWRYKGRRMLHPLAKTRPVREG